MTNIGRQLGCETVRGWQLALLCIFGCGSLTPVEAVDALDGALERAVSRPEIHNAVMWIDAPGKGLDQGFAKGIANESSGRPMTVDTPFLSASVGKLFLATAVLALTQRGVLSLDDPLDKWVASHHFQGLAVPGGDEALAGATVRQLLAHRTGLADYFSDPSSDGVPRIYDLIAQERLRRWSRGQLLDYARQHYGAAPKADPEGFHYADTNYDLLGLVVEGATGLTFVQVVRDQVLTPLGLSHTWYHAFEPPPVGLPPIADVFVGDVNMHGAASLSADQAGGGIATTVGDLKVLMRSLARGTPVPWSAFEENYTRDAVHDGIDVGLCAWRIRPGGIFFALFSLPELVGHSGSTGVWSYYDREGDAVYVGSVNQSQWQEDHIRFLLRDLLPVMQRVK